jgi:hypothetical protein
LSSGWTVEQHNSHFPQGTEDIVWLPFVGRNQWVLITKDQRIRKHPFERQVLINSGVRNFVLHAGNLKAAEMAAIYTTAMPAMLTLIAEQAAPFIAKIEEQAIVSLTYPLP